MWTPSCCAVRGLDAIGIGVVVSVLLLVIVVVKETALTGLVAMETPAVATVVVGTWIATTCGRLEGSTGVVGTVFGVDDVSTGVVAFLAVEGVAVDACATVKTLVMMAD